MEGGSVSSGVSESAVSVNGSDVGDGWNMVSSEWTHSGGEAHRND